MSVRFAIGAALWLWAMAWLLCVGLTALFEGWNTFEVLKPRHYIGAVISVAYLEWCKRLELKNEKR